jgi:hypothetical protein
LPTSHTTAAAAVSRLALAAKRLRRRRQAGQQATAGGPVFGVEQIIAAAVDQDEDFANPFGDVGVDAVPAERLVGQRAVVESVKRDPAAHFVVETLEHDVGDAAIRFVVVQPQCGQYSVDALRSGSTHEAAVLRFIVVDGGQGVGREIGSDCGFAVHKGDERTQNLRHQIQVVRRCQHLPRKPIHQQEFDFHRTPAHRVARAVVGREP